MTVEDKSEYPWIHLQTLTFCYWLHNLPLGHAAGTVLECGADISGNALNCPDQGSKGKIKPSTLHDNIVMRTDPWPTTS